MAVIKDNKRATSAKRLAPAIARPNVIVNKPAPIKPRAYTYNPGFSASEPKVPSLYGNYAFPKPFVPRALSSLPTTNPMPGVRSRVSVSPYARPAATPASGVQLPPPIPTQTSFDTVTQGMQDNPIVSMWKWIMNKAGLNSNDPYTGQ